MFTTFKSMSRSRFGLFILVGVFVANALVGLANFGMPTKDTFVAQVEVFSNLTGDDLAVAGGGYESTWVGCSAHMNFWVTTDSDRLIQVELKRSLNLLGWRLTKFTDAEL